MSYFESQSPSPLPHLPFGLLHGASLILRKRNTIQTLYAKDGLQKSGGEKLRCSRESGRAVYNEEIYELLDRSIEGRSQSRPCRDLRRRRPHSLVPFKDDTIFFSRARVAKTVHPCLRLDKIALVRDVSSPGNDMGGEYLGFWKTRTGVIKIILYHFPFLRRSTGSAEGSKAVEN